MNAIRLQSSTFSQSRTYLAAAVFIAGNIALPQLCHLFALGGPTFLPIYFFTLIGAYLYGWRAGLLTATASPLINSLLFGMPAVAVLPAILLKSVLLAIAASYAARRFGRPTIAVLIGVVLFYQVVGTLGEWALYGNFYAAVSDFRIGIPGLLIQLIGGYLILRKAD